MPHTPLHSTCSATCVQPMPLCVGFPGTAPVLTPKTLYLGSWPRHRQTFLCGNVLFSIHLFTFCLTSVQVPSKQRSFPWLLPFPIFLNETGLAFLSYTLITLLRHSTILIVDLITDLSLWLLMSISSQHEDRDHVFLVHITSIMPSPCSAYNRYLQICWIN